MREEVGRVATALRRFSESRHEEGDVVIETLITLPALAAGQEGFERSFGRHLREKRVGQKFLESTTTQLVARIVSDFVNAVGIKQEDISIFEFETRLVERGIGIFTESRVRVCIKSVERLVGDGLSRSA